jgi:phosphonate transport system ATP-binding protein
MHGVLSDGVRVDSGHWLFPDRLLACSYPWGPDGLTRLAERGITVIVNLHTLDTARAYCQRIIGMAAGRIVFDGRPQELTTAVAREIYGAEGLKEAFSEAVTSTSLDGLRPAAAQFSTAFAN